MTKGRTPAGVRPLQMSRDITLVETMGFEPTTPACKGLPGVRGGACEAARVQVGRGGGSGETRGST
jgi:hypothetical protein